MTTYQVTGTWRLPREVSLLVEDGMAGSGSVPRAVVTGGALFLSTISGTTTGGDVVLHRYLSGVLTTFTLHADLEVDDHNQGAIIVLPSGKLAVFYSSHVDTVTRWKVSTAAAPDITGFGTQKTIAAAPDAGTVTYSQPIILGDNVYVFRRINIDGGNGRPQQMCVDTVAAVEAGTATFATRTTLLTNGAQRPYPLFALNGEDRIDVFTTNSHPGEDTSVSLYHMYMQLDGATLKYYQSDGTEITDPPFDVDAELTLVQAATGAAQNESFTREIRIGADGHPRCLSFRYPGGADNVEYWHHRWTGSAWVNTKLSEGTDNLADADNLDAPGLCFDGKDTSIIYMATGAPAEIGKYKLNEATSTVTLLSMITSSSASHNARPFSPLDYGANISLTWHRGTYVTFSDYEMDVFMLEVA